MLDRVIDLFDKVFDVVRGLAGVLIEPFLWPVRALRDEVGSEPRVSLVLLLVLLVCVVRAVLGGRLAALALVPLSFAWMLFDGPLKGPHLYSLSWAHGITAADLVAFAALLIACWRLVPVLIGRVPIIRASSR